jgi:hypothetical protein
LVINPANGMKIASVEKRERVLVVRVAVAPAELLNAVLLVSVELFVLDDFAALSNMK